MEKGGKDLFGCDLCLIGQPCLPSAWAGRQAGRFRVVGWGSACIDKVLEPGINYCCSLGLIVHVAGYGAFLH